MVLDFVICISALSANAIDNECCREGMDYRLRDSELDFGKSKTVFIVLYALFINIENWKNKANLIRKQGKA